MIPFLNAGNVKRIRATGKTNRDTAADGCPCRNKILLPPEICPSEAHGIYATGGDFSLLILQEILLCYNPARYKHGSLSRTNGSVRTWCCSPSQSRA